MTKFYNYNGRSVFKSAPLFVALAIGSMPAYASTILASAQDYAVLGAASVTNTGKTRVRGDLGTSPGSSITGVGSIKIKGTLHQTDTDAQQAQLDALNAYNVLASQAFTSNLSGQDLGNMTLTPGVYHFDSTAQLTGTLTLNAMNDSNALFIFQIGSGLTTASSSVVKVLNGGADTGVFWQVGSSATLGTSTIFAGNILADQSITLNTGASIMCGRALALNASVTMDSNTISNNCSSQLGNTSRNGFGPRNGRISRSDFGSNGFSNAELSTVSAVPVPAAAWLFGSGLLGMVGIARRKF